MAERRPFSSRTSSQVQGASSHAWGKQAGCFEKERPLAFRAIWREYRLMQVHRRRILKVPCKGLPNGLICLGHSNCIGNILWSPTVLKASFSEIKYGTSVSWALKIYFPTKTSDSTDCFLQQGNYGCGTGQQRDGAPSPAGSIDRQWQMPHWSTAQDEPQSSSQA